MKKFLFIMSTLFVLAGSMANSALLSIGAGIIVGSAIDPTIGGYTAMGLFTLSFVMPQSPSYAFITFTQGICEKVQSSLNAILGNNTPALKRTQVGYLQALTSPQNTAGTQVIPIDPGTGKIKQVRIKYIQRGTEQDLTTAEVTGCTTEIEKEPFEETVSITNYLGTKGLKFTEAEMRKLCEADSEYMAGIINAEIDPLIVKLNKLLIMNQSANFGSFNPATSSPKSVQLLQASNNNAANYYGESLIMEDVENLDSNAKPIVIGGGKLAHYTRQVGIGCCNDLGQNIGQAGNMDFFRDRFVGNVLGNADDFILLIPGYSQLLTFNKYVGSYAKENDVFSHGTITDPLTGLVFDMKWQYNSCDDYYFAQFGLNWEQFFIPANAFSAYDELNGVNFSLHYRATGA